MANTKYKLVNCRIIAGLPTTGKTYFMRELEKAGKPALDIDDVLYHLMKEEDADKFWDVLKGLRRDEAPLEFEGTDVKPMVNALYSSSLALYTNHWLKNNPNGVILTNTWGPDYRKLIDKEFLAKGSNPDDHQLPIGFYLPDPAEVHRRSLSRDEQKIEQHKSGGKSLRSSYVAKVEDRIKTGKAGISPELAEAWIKGWVDYGPSAFKILIPLTNDQYISDFFVW